MTNIQRKLPNLIIAGITKAGTTSLYAYTSQHPDVGASAVKETCYFLPLRYDRDIDSIRTYEDYFSHCAGKPVLMESSAGYFVGGRRLATAVRNALGEEVHIVIMLREPVSRLVSFFNYQKSHFGLSKEMTLGGYVELCMAMSEQDLKNQDNDPYTGLADGQYADYLADWLDVFGDRLLVLFFDDLCNDARGVMRALFAFAEINSDIAEQIELSIENKTIDFRSRTLQRAALAFNAAGERFWRSHPRVKRFLRGTYYWFNGLPFETHGDEEVRLRLSEYYRPYNARLATQLRAAGVQNLPAWLSHFSENTSPASNKPD